MNKWLVIILSMAAISGQICIGMEQEDKDERPKLKSLDTGDHTPTMVAVDFKKSTHKPYATPHHTNKKFFRKSKTGKSKTDKIVTQFAQDMFPGIEYMASAQKPEHQKQKLEVELPKSTWGVVQELATCDSELKAALLKKQLEERHAKHLTRGQS